MSWWWWYWWYWWWWWWRLLYEEAWWSPMPLGFVSRTVPGAVWVRTTLMILSGHGQKDKLSRGKSFTIALSKVGIVSGGDWGASQAPADTLGWHSLQTPCFLCFRVLGQQWNSVLWNIHKIQLTIKHFVNLRAVRDPNYISSFLRNGERQRKGI